MRGLPLDDAGGSTRPARFEPLLKLVVAGLAVVLAYAWFREGQPPAPTARQLQAYEAALGRCRALRIRPGPSRDFAHRAVSDRYRNGTQSVLITNARLWTGNDGGREVLDGAEICLEGGLIRSINGKALGGGAKGCAKGDDLVRYNAKGAWVTPGLVDMHSHIGVEPSPGMEATNDGNAKQKIPTHAWFRALDGINTHDAAYRLTVAGGVTSALILPGSAHAINGEAYAIKLRETVEGGTNELLIEPHGPDGRVLEREGHKAWRYMKNPSATLDYTRPETAHAFRTAFRKAAAIRDAQDDFCASLHAAHDAQRGRPARVLAELEKRQVEVAAFPGLDEAGWEVEPIVGVLRGAVKAMTHCYEGTDMAQYIRLSHEFKFPVAAFHHAHEAYIIPSLLNSSYGEPPAAAIFSLFSLYKREAYRTSNHAAQLLDEAGIDVVIKSDHPGVDSRFLNMQAGQARHFGLSEEAAMNAITTVPAKRMGLDHRIGFVRPGYDADIVVWDSHPLALGAAPLQVYIDGIAQLTPPTAPPKKASRQSAPPAAQLQWYAQKARELGGEATDLTGVSEVVQDGSVTFVNVSAVYRRNGRGALAEEVEDSHGGPVSVVIESGRISCVGRCSTKGEVIDLHGGTLTPGLTVLGTSLGLDGISMEASTSEGPARALSPDKPAQAMLRAVDALSLASKDLKLARLRGVTRALSALPGEGNHGVGVLFDTGAEHAGGAGAVLKEDAIVYLTMGHTDERSSVATQISELRRMLRPSKEDSAEQLVTEADYFAAVRRGDIPLLVGANKADVMVALLRLKREVNDAGGSMNLVIVGAQEAHLVASDIAAAGVSVIVTPVRPFPHSWDEKRILPGRPLGPSLLEVLLSAGVRTAITVGNAFPRAPDNWRAQEFLWDAAWVAQDIPQHVSRAQALAMASTELEDILGLGAGGGSDGGAARKEVENWVAWEGDAFEFGSRMRAVGKGRAVEVYH